MSSFDDQSSTATYARVYGRVQGVGFRYQTLMQARKLNLVGWVRNAMDGTVEVHFAGGDEARRHMTEWLERGPVGARVERVETTDRPLTRSHEGFEIIA